MEWSEEKENDSADEETTETLDIPSTDDLTQSFEDERKTQGFQEVKWLLEKLPYAKEMLEQADDTFQKIKIGLALSLAEQDELRLVNWTKELKRYIDLYGYRFSKADHVLLIRLLLPQIRPGEQYNDTLAVLEALTYLLKKEGLLTRKDLQIDVRPIYEYYVENIFKRMKMRHPANVGGKLREFVKLARNFFHEDDVQWILEKTRPFMLPLASCCTNAFYTNELFIPMNFSDDVQRSHGAGLWFDEAWHWYSVICENGGEDIRNHISLMFGRLASEAPNFIHWDDEKISVIFTRLIRQIGLPGSGHEPSFELPWFCELVAYLLGSSSHEGVMYQLQTLCKLVESSCHPSNDGKHMTVISSMMKRLFENIIDRAKRERTSKTTSKHNPIPDHMHLKQEHFDALIRTFLPCLKHLMMSTVSTNDAIRGACALSPKIIVSLMLELIYPALDCAEDPERLYSILLVLRTTISSLVLEEDFRKEAIILLEKLVPCIDWNDTCKMHLSAKVAGNILRLVKIADSSCAIGAIDDLTNEEKTLCLLTAHFKMIVEAYLNTLFRIINSIGDQEFGLDFSHHAKRTDEYEFFEGCVLQIIEPIFQNSSEEIFLLAYDKLYAFLQNTTFDNDSLCEVVCRFAEVAVDAHPDFCFPKFLALISTKLEQLPNIKDMTAEEKEQDHYPANWWIRMAISIIEYATAPILLKHWDNLLVLIDLVHSRYFKPELPVQVTKIVLRVLCSISTINHHKERKKMDLPIDEYLPIRHWSEPIDRNTWEAEWYIPTQEALSKAELLLHLYLEQVLEDIQGWSTGSSPDRKRLLHLLTILKEVFDGASFSLPLFDGSPVPIEETLARIPRHICKPVDSPVLKFRGQCLRDRVLDIIENLLNHVLKHSEDDVKSIQEIICILYMVNSYRGITKTTITQKDERLEWDLNIINKLESARRLQESNVNLAVTNIHLKRVYVKCDTDLREQNVRVLDLLIRLSTNHYPQIRKMAQWCVAKMFNRPSLSFSLVRDRVLEYLDPEKDYFHDQIKGALHLLHDGYAIDTFESQFIIWKALLSIKDGQKESIIKMVDEILSSNLDDSASLRIDFEVTEEAKLVAYEILGAQELSINAEERRKQKLEAYKKVVLMICDFAKIGFHWRREAWISGLLSKCTRQDYPMPPELFSVFFDHMFHDHIYVRIMGVYMASGYVMMLKPKAVKKEIVIEHQPQKWPISYGYREDNRCLVHETSKLPTTDEEWDKFQFFKNSYSGWYTWPRKRNVYAPLEEQIHIDRQYEDLNEEEKAILNKIRDPEWLNKFVSINTVEGIYKDDFEEAFSKFAYHFSRTFNDLICEPLQAILSQLALNHKKANHRFAAELISGLIKGSRLWRWKRQRNMWSWLIPLINNFLDNVSKEARPFWKSMIFRVYSTADPRSLQPLSELIMRRFEAKFTPVPVHLDVACKSELYLAWNMCHALGWRGMEYNHRALKVSTPLLANTSSSIRQILASSLALMTKYHVPGSYVDPDWPTNLLPATDQMCLDLYGVLFEKQFSVIRDLALDDELLRKYRTAMSAAIFFCRERLNQVEFCMSLSPTMIEWFPIIFEYGNHAEDEDLQDSCLKFCMRILRKYLRPSTVALIFNSVNDIYFAKETHDKTRVGVIGLLHWTSMINFVECKKRHSEIEEIAKTSLDDAEILARGETSEMLKDMFITGFLDVHDGLIDHFFERAADSDEIKSHGGALGLSSIINAAPYSVPTYLPGLLEKLAKMYTSQKGCLFRDTVEHAFAEFKRTHQESWEEHKKCFTQDQLDIIGRLDPSCNHYV